MGRSKLLFSTVVFCLSFTVSLAEVAADVTDEASEPIALTYRVDPLTKLALHGIPLTSGENPAVSSGDFENSKFHHHLHHHHHFYDHHHRHHEDTDTDSDDDEEEDHSLKKKKKKRAFKIHGHGGFNGEKQHCHGFMKRVLKFLDRYF